MGLFDLFKGGGKKNDGDKPPKAPKPKANAAAKWAERAGDKRAQNYDRQEAIAALAEMGTPEAVAALLKRFTFVIDPSITDQEEKEAAFAGIRFAGKEAIEPVRAFAAKAESLAWPMRIVKDFLTEDEYVEELLLWLSKWDTEYAKFIDAKIQLLTALDEHVHPRIAPEVARFLEDVNELARFYAASAILTQNDASFTPQLLKALVDEESLRLKNKIAEGLATKGWLIVDEQREQVRKNLPGGYTVDGEGRVNKREGGQSYSL